jgi:hypothetical protein
VTDVDTFRTALTSSQRRGESIVPKVTRGHRLACADWLRQRVLVELRDEWPLGPRGLMYEATRDPRLVNERTGKRYTKADLTDGCMNWERLLGDLRRIGDIPWRAISDARSDWSTSGFGVTDPEGTAGLYVRMIDGERWDRGLNQPHIIVVVEAVGEVAALRKAASDLPVQWFSGSGFCPIPSKRKIGIEAVNRWIQDEQETIVGHVGDFDPAGLEQYFDVRDDATQFAIDDLGDDDPDDYLTFERITLRLEDVDEYILPEARNEVPKTGKKAKKWWPDSWGGSAEFEDLDRDIRRGMVVEWIVSNLDMAEIDRLRDDDENLRTRIASDVLERLQGDDDDAN